MWAEHETKEVFHMAETWITFIAVVGLITARRKMWRRKHARLHW